jgi:transposase-like protein
LPATVSTDQQAMIEFKGSHFERDVILWAVRWYVAYPISYRQLEEMMDEHGVAAISSLPRTPNIILITH